MSLPVRAQLANPEGPELRRALKAALGDGARDETFAGVYDGVHAAVQRAMDAGVRVGVLRAVDALGRKDGG